MSLIDLSRWQFASTVIFHLTFPAITVGLSILLCVLYGLHWRSGKLAYLQMFRFWRRIFAVGFAIGVVSGIVITVAMGLGWGAYAARTGPIIGPIIGMEVVTAFFVEAGFVGILLYGDGRVRRGPMFAATVVVAIGTLLTSSWIVAANSWLQTPAGSAPSFLWRWPHLVLAVLISAGFFVAGIGAYYLVKGQALPFARRTVSIGLGVAAMLLPVHIFVGDQVTGHMFPLQLSKAEAMAPAFWGFRIMFLAALWIFGTVVYATILRFRRRLWTSRRFHRFLLWTTPVGVIALLGGWVVAETGQSWVVFGLLRTPAAVSNLAPGQILFSVLGFSLLFLVMLVGYVAYMVRAMRIGPEREDPDEVVRARSISARIPVPCVIVPRAISEG